LIKLTLALIFEEDPEKAKSIVRWGQKAADLGIDD
jgi:hypothetical protein